MVLDCCYYDVILYIVIIYYWNLSFCVLYVCSYVVYLWLRCTTVNNDAVRFYAVQNEDEMRPQNP